MPWDIYSQVIKANDYIIWAPLLSPPTRLYSRSSIKTDIVVLEWGAIAIITGILLLIYSEPLIPKGATVPVTEKPFIQKEIPQVKPKVREKHPFLHFLKRFWRFIKICWGVNVDPVRLDKP